MKTQRTVKKMSSEDMYHWSLEKEDEMKSIQNGIPWPQEGVKYDMDKPRMDLIPPEVVNELAKILTFGAKKYGDRNWEAGMAWSRPYAALIRHILAWWSGEDKDPETGESHLAHAACNIAFLITYEQRQIGIDDRRKT